MLIKPSNQAKDLVPAETQSKQHFPGSERGAAGALWCWSVLLTTRRHTKPPPISSVCLWARPCASSVSGWKCGWSRRAAHCTEAQWHTRSLGISLETVVMRYMPNKVSMSDRFAACSLINRFDAQNYFWGGGVLMNHRWALCTTYCSTEDSPSSKAHRQ